MIKKAQFSSIYSAYFNPKRWNNNAQKTNWDGINGEIVVFISALGKRQIEHGKQKLIMSDWGSSVDEAKKAQEFYNLLQFIYSKKRLGLQPSVAFNERSRKKLGP